jgi:hypothetical protein
LARSYWIAPADVNDPEPADAAASVGDAAVGEGYDRPQPG